MTLYAIKDIFKNQKLIIKKWKQYFIYSEFKNDTYNNGIGYVILGEDNEFHGYDSILFISEKEMTIKKYNL